MEIPFSIYLLVPSSLIILIGGFYSFNKVKDKKSLIFFLLTIVQALFSFGTFILWRSCDTDAAVIFWDRLLYIPAIMMPPLIYHFSVEFSELKNVKDKIFLCLSYAIALGLIVISQTNYFVSGTFHYQWGCHTNAQIGHHIFFIYTVIILLFAIYNFYKFWTNKKNDTIKRNQAFIIFLAFLILSFLAGALVSAYKIGMYPFFYICLPLFALIMTYAITEQNVFTYVMATDILIGVMIILIATIFIFPEIALKDNVSGYVARIIIFLLLLAVSWLLLRHNHRELARKEEAERISRLKSEFISIVSHQLRTPLSAIRGYTSMLQEDDYGNLPQEADTAVSHIHESSVSMIKLINSLLSISRLEKGQVELKIEDVSLVKIIEECVKDIQLLAKEKGLTIKYDKPKTVVSSIKGDSEKLKQAISNIINNAVLYTPKGKIIISLKTEENNVIIQIKDTGVGIEKQEIDKMFRSFSRGKGGQELYVQGTGLGLYVAKNFIEMHNGRIWAESEGKDKGSCFTIELPIKNRIEIKHNFTFSDEQNNK